MRAVESVQPARAKTHAELCTVARESKFSAPGAKQPSLGYWQAPLEMVADEMKFIAWLSVQPKTGKEQLLSLMLAVES